jgi:3-dehydroquinate synthetase
MGCGIDAKRLNGLIDTLIGGRPATLADARALDANPSLAAAVPSAQLCVMLGGEDAKSMETLERILAWLTSIGVGRTDPLIVVGGGTLGDVGGLAAALHHRGMSLVHVATTWLAQADSSIGGKVAIDLPGAKNAVGAFWPASLIVSDIELLNTLPIDRRRDGMAECLKAGLIGDPALWDLVEQRGRAALLGDDLAAVYAITERAVRVKLAIVGRDPTEQGERRVLNLGHTLGHALEAESEYTLAHGAAVALGLRAVAAIASRRGADPSVGERIDGVLANLGFELHRGFDRNTVLAALSHDKKRANGRQRWILPMEVGRVIEIDDVTDEELDLALAAIAA